ncbi:hypothetical protein J4Q44_G00376400 [Coregonus suidteri]|uniref:B30.2/SPRY domain-containing protein n=1 Tax=Coregonus suidteri TaxID=861788 RepID=A0AAN8KMK0_9TELE
MLWIKNKRTEARHPLQTETQLNPSPRNDASVRSRKDTAEFDINKARTHEVYVTLDVDTAHPKLKINGKSLHWIGESSQRNIDIENCFDEEPFVLGNTGRALKTYWEVDVKEKDDWVLGVAKANGSQEGAVGFQTK